MSVSRHEAIRAFVPTSKAPAASGRHDHYQSLDFLRGLAALAVVLYHFSERMNLPLMFSHGYLAVDFFFTLSGFVMASAYGRPLRQGKLPSGRFYAQRAIRLMPLILLGTFASFVVELGRPGVVDQPLHLMETVTALVLGSILLPTPFVATLQNTLFPLDGPVWSLFYEAIANFLMPFYVRTAVIRVLVGVTLIVCGVVLAWSMTQTGTVHVGYQLSDVPLGLARVGFSFTVGVVLFSVRHHAPQIPFAVPPILLAMILVVPSLGFWEGAYQAACVFAILPAITFMAVGARCGASGRLWSALSGDLSYPLYALHFPFVRLVTVIAARYSLAAWPRLIVAIAATTGCVCVAFAAFAFYDLPLRQWLSGRLTRATLE